MTISTPALIAKAMRKLTTSIPGVYTITCIETDKVYVGQSLNCTRRWAGHVRDLNSGKHRNWPLRRAWAAYGQGAFVFAIVEPYVEGGPSLDALEMAVLARYPSTYNLDTMGGGERLTASAETRAKQGAKAKARWADPAYKERLSKVHRDRLADPAVRAERSRLMREVSADPEVKAARSAGQIARWDDEARARKGEKTKSHWNDPEHRAKQEEARKASWADPEKRTRRVKGLTAAWDSLSPEERAARTEAASAKQRTPEGRAEAAEKARLGWEKRRAREQLEREIEANPMRSRIEVTF